MLTATTGEGNTNFVAYKIGSDSPWYTSNAAQVIPSGPNTITLRLCEKGKNPSTEYLNETVLSNITIYSGLTTTIGGTWDDPTTAAKFEITTGSSDTYYIVTFDPNYDNAPVIYQQVKSSSKTTAPSVSRSGWAVSKWTENADGSGEAFNSSNPVNANKTYYAQWGRTRGFGAVSDTAGRPDNVCEWVQLWAGGPKFATFNVGATIDDYSQATGKFSTEVEKKALYTLANTGGLYGWGGKTDTRVMNASGSYTYALATDGCSSSSSIQGTVNDTATSLWGNVWNMLSKSNIIDLQTMIKNGICKVSYADGNGGTYGNLRGTIISGTGDYAGNEVFFPYIGIVAATNEGAIINNESSLSARYWLCDKGYTFYTAAPPNTNNVHYYVNGYGGAKEHGKGIRAIYVGD